MTAYTSTQSGDFDANSTWGGGGHPSSTSDTATISADNVVTVLAGHTNTVGAMEVSAGSSGRTQLTVNGTLNIGGTLLFDGTTKLLINGDGVLDLNGHTMSVIGDDHQRVLAGTAGHIATIQSTGSPAMIDKTGTSRITNTCDYWKLDNIGDSVLARSHTSGLLQHWAHGLANDCGLLDHDETTTSVNWGFVYNNNDWRNVKSGGGFKIGSGDFQAIGSNPRTFAENTFKGGSNLGGIVTNFVPWDTFTDMTGNVIERFQINPSNGAFPVTGDALINLDDDNEGMVLSGADVTDFTDSYLYFDGINHAFGFQISGITSTGCVHEGTGLGLNWYLFGTAASGAITISFDIFLGSGTPISMAQGNNAATVNWFNNTSFMHNTIGLANAADFALGLETEQTADLTGVVNYYNNLNADSNVTSDPQYAISLRDAVGSQLTLADYNGHAGYVSMVYTATTIGYEQNRGGGAIPGVGANDLHADPQFVDFTRTLATWDASLGGPGTVANAVAELLKLNGTGGAWNSAYNVAALVSWVRAGFVPTNAAFQGTARSGADFGALPVVPPPPPAPLTFTGIARGNSVVKFSGALVAA